MLQFYRLLLLITSFFLLVVAIEAKGENSDSCSALKFHSPFEKEVFAEICSGMAPDYLKMAVGVNPLSNNNDLLIVKGKVKNEVEKLKTKIATLKKPAAQLKFIFDDVQKTFLKQYDLDADFTDMFLSGNYNCLTATILYALLLDELSIKYTIKFAPGHVYLIVKGNDLQYIFETTDPIGGCIELNKAIQNTVSQGMRVAQYILSENQKKQTGVLLENYFIRLNKYDIKGLIGYQYMNLAIQKMNKNDLVSAFYYTEKAKIFTPVDDLSNLSSMLLATSVEKASIESTERAHLMVMLYNTVELPNKKKLITEDFTSVIYSCLLGDFPAPDSSELIYKIMIEGISDNDVVTVIKRNYFETYYAYLRTKKSNEERLAFIYKLYSEDENNPNYKSKLTEEVRDISYRVQSGAVDYYDSLAVKYPKLINIELFIYQSCNSLVVEAENAFRSNNIEKGERLLKEYADKNYYDKNKPAYCNPADAYSLAGSIYFRKGDYAKAKAAFKKGLSYDPDNYELKRKLKEINN
jgi:tetratricopeptide (TPR) repeat protein